MAMLATVAALGIGMACGSTVSAAPAYGTALGTAATGLDLTQNVRWWGHRRGFFHPAWWCARHPFRC